MALLRKIAKAAVIALMLTPVSAEPQVLRPAGALVNDLGRLTNGALNEVQTVAQGALSQTDSQVNRALMSPSALLDQREDRLRRIVAHHPRDLELDERGQMAVRGVVLGLSPSPEALARALAAGFTVESRLEIAPGETAIGLRAPAGVSAREGLKRLRSLDPDGRYDYDHVYEPGGATLVGAGTEGLSGAGAPRVTVGMVDGGVDLAHPAFAHAKISVQGFAPGGARPSAHGTAVAFLMVGETHGFRAAAAGAQLFAADVYGASPTGGSVEAVVRALLWLQSEHAAVVNISLVGPPNLVLQATVARMTAAGEVLVAPVGNDGPAAPPAYPAAYPGVVAAIPVDARQQLLLESGRLAKPCFTAPGADMAAASLGGGLTPVRGSSFAAPVVAAHIAAAMADTRDARLAVQAVAASALHRGEARFGLGLVGWTDRAPARF